MNSFGRIFKLTIYGTSHNPEIGLVIDGCPVGLGISENDFYEDILRRTTGAQGTSSRLEEDNVHIKSGVFNGYTDGTPMVICFYNNNIKSSDYDFDGFFRPGHADFTANIKYKSFNNPFGGGQFSGRMTLPLVSAGVIAKKIISKISINANLIHNNILDEILKLEKDSIGGIVQCNVSELPIGLGEPFFDGLESLISHAIFSIPGVKAIEFGEGIKSAYMRGSEYNDTYIGINGQTHTNNSGGINGGISNGNELYFRVFFRPAASIAKSQETLNFKTGKIQNFELKGRHDACYVIRTPVIVEAMTAIVLADLLLLSKIYR